MVTPTDDGLEWYGQYAVDAVAGPLDTIAVGTGTGAEDPTASSLQNEIYRADSSTSVVDFEQDSGDDTVTYATIELTGGLEIPTDTEVTEIGVIASGPSPEVLAWYSVSAPVPFPSGERNKLIVPLDLNRVTQ
jgi:chitodextrinase